MDRKSFIKLGTGTALAGALPFSLGKPVHRLAALENTDLSTWELIRDQFPLKKDLQFLNNGTMGITPNPVLLALQKSYEHLAEHAAYPHHNNELETQLAQLIGCSYQEIGITKNVSEGINHIAWGIPLKPGDEVIMTTHEHIGGCAAWMRRVQIDKIKVIAVPINSNPEEFIDTIRKSITKKTKVLAIPHIPCTTGQILPVKDLCQLAREKGIISVIDGAHPLGMIRFNVKELGCDYYAGCFHKWMLGPIGTGWMYIRKEMIEKTKITHIAAYSVNQFDMSTVPPSMDTPILEVSRYAYGTFSGPQWEGCKAALHWYHQIGPERIEKRIKQLHQYLRNTLEQAGNKIEIINSPREETQGGQLAFRIKEHQRESEQVSQQNFVNFARKNGLILRYVGENKLNCIRVSTHYYNQESEINKLFELLTQYAWS
jgi:selenocysteine lyase/cysteine desulfurase